MTFRHIILSGSFFVGLYSQISFAEVVKKIEIEGNRRVEESTIKSYLKVKIGQDLSQEDINKQLKELFATSFFNEVELNLENGILRVHLSENPTISEIDFEGNVAVQNDALTKAVPIKKGSVYDEDRINKAVQNIISYYQGSGRYNTRVLIETEYLDMNRVKLIFLINEGTVLKIRGIRFSGNEFFSDNELKKNLSIKEIAPLDFFSTGNRFDQYKTENQARIIENFYKQKGFIDAKVISSVAHITADYRFAYVFFTIREGEQYKIGEITLENKVYGLYLGDFYKKGLKVKTGDIFSFKKVRIEGLRLNNEVIEEQEEPFVVVDTKTDKNEDESIINVTYLFKNSNPVYVEEINITGNDRTRESVIRNLLTFQEGDPFNYKFLQESKIKIRSLSHISSVSADYVPGSSPGKIKVFITVKEAGSGYFFAAGGYSSNDGIVGQFMYKESNFLGTDLDLSAQASFSKKKLDFNTGIAVPHFPWESTTLGFSAFSSKDASKLHGAYSKSKLGGSINFSYLITSELAHIIGYTTALTELKRNENVHLASSIRETVKKRLGRGTETTLSSTLRYTPIFEDSQWFISIVNRNNVVNSTLDKSGVVSSYLTEELDITHKLPLAESGFLLTTDLSFGFWENLDSSDLTPDEGFFLGGESFPGFKYGGIGPKVEESAVNTEYVGSDTYLTLKSQLSMQIFSSKILELYGIAFAMGGTSYLRKSAVPASQMVNDKGIRVTSGLGVQWNSPIGPMQFTWSWPIKKNRFDKTEVFQFSIGGVL